jgi:hypothetical protein
MKVCGLCVQMLLSCCNPLRPRLPANSINYLTGASWSKQIFELLIRPNGEDEFRHNRQILLIPLLFGKAKQKPGE